MGNAIVQAGGQAWPPFVLVAGLLLIGAVVEADGMFKAAGVRIEGIAGGPVVLFATLLCAGRDRHGLVESGYGGGVHYADRHPRGEATPLR